MYAIKAEVSDPNARTWTFEVGRGELEPFDDWDDDRPETELNFKLYRQAMNKIVALSEGAAAFLRGFFEQD